MKTTPRQFRAWDSRESKWVNNFCIMPSGNPQIIRSDKEFTKVVEDYYRAKGSVIPQGDYAEIDFTDWYAIDCLTVQQYIGKEDINNVPIFEGDIVRRYTGYVFVVEFGPYLMGYKHNASCFGYQWHEGDEVIGNIFQNADLIK